MASGDSNKKLDRISTKKILQKLKAVDGDNTEFFYLYVSTAGKERRRQKRKELPRGQQTLNFPSLPSGDEESDDAENDEDDDDDDQMEDDDDDQMEDDDDRMGDDTTSQPISPPDGDMVQNSPSLSKDKARSEAMNKVHKVVLPKVLSTDGWRKVYDKDMKLTYRALYFNIIRKHQNENDNTYIQRVSKIIKTLKGEADQVMKEHNVNFKFNSLLSKPFLYDEVALLEQSRRQESTQQQSKQMRIDDYVK